MALIDDSDVPAAFTAGHGADAVTAAVEWASSAVEAFCGRHFAVVTDDVVLVSPRQATALLPDPPVTDISLVEGWLPRDGTMQWIELDDYAFTAEGLVYDTTGLPGVTRNYTYTWPVLPRSLRVTYTHGYSTLPQPVADAVIKAAGAYLANPDGLIQRTVDDVTYRWDMGGALDDTLLGSYRLTEL